jgi:tRNA nucleotidyltransferase/poly(A) polymerase
MIMFNAAVLLVVVVVENANAFQNVGLLNQAISAWDGTCFMSVDELFFAVTNLLDSQQSLARMKQGLSFRMSPTSFYLNEEQDYQYDYESQAISNTISLTKQEQDLFALVKEVRDKHCPSTTIRVAGGWVRDKLLRKTTSHDIDFVLNDISGSEFARLFHRHVSNHSEQIAEHQSAERSKHLQTASLQYRDFCIDFCHLRFETYSPDSRVPEKTNRASPVEDAWRRDLTINSLFYNINTNQVEDWTEQGLQDLQLGVIATPVMTPLATLLEDPLRILRAIRFAAQLSFSMETSLKKAATDSRVRRALRLKVSRDRIGNEIDLVFQTRDPRRGVQFLMETNLIDAVFIFEKPCNAEMMPPPLDVYEAGFGLLTRTQALASRIFVEASQWDESRRRYLWYSAFLKPFCDMSPSISSRGGKKSRRNGSILYQILTQGLKRPVRDTQSIERIIKGAHHLQTFLETNAEAALQCENMTVDTLLSESNAQWKRIADIRWEGHKVLKQIGPLWKESLVLAIAEQYDRTEAVEQYEQWITWMVDRLHLDQALSIEPLLNGSQIQQRVLPNARDEAFKQIMEAQEEWQVRHGYAARADNNHEARLIDHLRDAFPEYAGHCEGQYDV